MNGMRVVMDVLNREMNRNKLLSLFVKETAL
jgi:hypothetical protein